MPRYDGKFSNRLSFDGHDARCFFISRSDRLPPLPAKWEVRSPAATLYLYDFGVWEKTETGQKRDVDFYTAAGLDPAVNLLHWFLCGFEGAVLTLHADVFSDHPPAQLQAIANHWFVTMFARFKGHPRLTFGSPFTRDVEKVCTKLKAMSGPMSFENMLKEITNVISLFSKGQAQTYFDFWNAVMNKRKPIPSHTDIQNLSVAS